MGDFVKCIIHLEVFCSLCGICVGMCVHTHTLKHRSQWRTPGVLLCRSPSCSLDTGSLTAPRVCQTDRLISQQALVYLLSPITLHWRDGPMCSRSHVIYLHVYCRFKVRLSRLHRKHSYLLSYLSCCNLCYLFKVRVGR